MPPAYRGHPGGRTICTTPAGWWIQPVRANRVFGRALPVIHARVSRDGARPGRSRDEPVTIGWWYHRRMVGKWLAIGLLVAGCGASSGGTPDAGVCGFPVTFEVGDDGEADVLAAVGPGRAAAGRARASDLPIDPKGLAVYAPGDFILANERVAMIIEDAGASDLYDPWGGRPVGLAAVEAGDLVIPADFGEILMLTGRYSVVTTSVSVLADGSDGGPAIVRAAGQPAPTPFIENIAF